MSERVQLAARTSESKKEKSASTTRKIESLQIMNSPADQVMYLQRTIGNQAVQRLIKSGALQAKLRIGQPGDVYEQEADALAKTIMGMPDQSSIQDEREDEQDDGIAQTKSGSEFNIQPKNIQPADEGTEGNSLPDPKDHIHAKSKTQGSVRTSSHLARTIQSTHGGSPMPQYIQKRIERHLGKNLEHVRVHNDKNAHNAGQSIQAKAFTHQNHIYLGQGQSSDDLPLLAHESVHVLQQGSSSPGIGSTSLQQVGGVPQIQRENTSDSHANTTTSNESSTAVETSSPTGDMQHGNESESVTDVSNEEPEGPGAPESETISSDVEEGQTEEAAAELGAGEHERGEETDTSEGLIEEQVEATEQNAEEGGELTPLQDSEDLALVDFELAEHERWAGSFGEMGTAGSDQRAQFLLDQAGQGAVSGAVGGAGMGFVMGAIGAGVGQIAGRRLATLAVSRGAVAVPVPGLGPAIGGVMAVAGLAIRDWGAAGDTIGRIGTGEGYEGLANDLEGIAEILDVATQVMDVLAGVLGGIAIGMWVGAVLSGGVLSPVAASLSAIALGINLATTAIGVIINVAVRPTVTALRALHTFESQGDPNQIEAEGRQLQSAAGQITGAVAGAAAGRVDGAAGRGGGARADRAVTRWQASRRGGTPAMSATAGPGPRIHVEVPEAPTRVEAGGTAPSRPAAVDGGSASTSRPASTEGPVARSSGDTDSSTSATHPPESPADLDSVIADLNASPEMAARLTDTRAPLPTRASPWSRSTGEARAYANKQAAQHRAATDMTGGEVQAGHTAAARHAYESGIREGDWDKQAMMDLHSRRGQGLDVTITSTDASGWTRTRTRTRHTAQEIVINDAVARSREAQGQLTPQGQLDAARYTQWMAENTPWDQRNVDMVRSGGLARPEPGPAVNPATGRVITSNPPSVSSPARSGSAASSAYGSNTQTARTTDRAAAMAQYHGQIRSDPGRESGVWRGSDGTYYVMQGDRGSVAPPSARRPLELIYHSHPTETGAARQGLVSQPSQAAGDIGVLQYQHGKGTPGRRQSSELHFPVYDRGGEHTGYGTTRFGYDPTHPLPLQVQTTLPGGRPSTQRYASLSDYEARTGIAAGGKTRADSTAARAAADTQLGHDTAAAQQRIDTIVEATRTEPVGIPGMSEGREFGRQMITDEAQAEDSSDRPEHGPAYTASVAGLQPGESIEIPINPAYPEPPGTRAELDLLLERVRATQGAQTELGGTEHAMANQAESQRTHSTQLGEAQTVTQDLATGRSSHQAAVESTQSTNTEQQSTAGEAISSLGRSAEEGTALYTLVGSLRVFQGLAHLFSYLPGDLGRRAEGAREDADGLITTLNRVSETEGVQSRVEEGRMGMGADAERIGTVSAEGQQTDAELTSGQDQVVELQQANAESLAETESILQQANQERSEAAASENESQTTHDALQSQLQAWAQAHRQAREAAIQDAVSRYSELGYQVREEQ